VAALLPETEGLSAFIEKAKEGHPSSPEETKKVCSRAANWPQAKAFAGPGLDIFERKGRTRQIIDLGWFDFVARRRCGFEFLYNFTGNTDCIILVTILQKVAFYPSRTRA